MADVRDYLEMRGDVTLAERPFNDVDNVALASLAYLDLTGIAPGPCVDASVSVREACDAFLARTQGDVASGVRSLAAIDERFVRALGASERLGTSRIRDYVDVFDGEKFVQFAALTIDLPDGHSYVAFRGTDSSLVGWREDFMLSFTVMESQRAAAAYLETEADRARRRGRRLLVGGHSKGGVLATYAAVTCTSGTRELIDHVWSDDGPCMAAEVVPERAAEVLGPRLTHVVPTYSIVGMLFDDGRPRTIVTSSADGALQHDPMTWQVGPLGLACADGLLPECRHMNEAIARWIASIGLDERERFTAELFDVLAAGGGETLSDVLASPVAVQRVLAALSEADPRTRELVGSLLAEAVTASVDATREVLAQRATDVVALAANRIQGLVGAHDPADEHAHHGDDDGA